jgi:hypothetical protein
MPLMLSYLQVEPIAVSQGTLCTMNDLILKIRQSARLQLDFSMDPDVLSRHVQDKNDFLPVSFTATLILQTGEEMLFMIGGCATALFHRKRYNTPLVVFLVYLRTMNL